IGTAGTGTTGDGNGEDGIDLRGSSAIIGGTGANNGNVITNNGNEGINIQGSGVTAHLIQGNIIGLDPDGSTGVGNVDVGIAIISGSGNTIGGTTAAARNIISNNFEGIEINTNNNVVQGNYIGTDITGLLNRGNRSDDGVEIQSSATGNLIGGTATGAGNLITCNAGDGVYIASGTGNSVLGNRIHSNTGLGIDLGANGVTANDNGDPDSGANNLQNFPVLNAVITNGTNSVTVGGSLNSTASTRYLLQFFASATADGTGYGEAERYLGSALVRTDASGNVTFSETVSAAVTAGEFVTVTATKIDNALAIDVNDATAYGDTSELAANAVAETSSITPNGSALSGHTAVSGSTSLTWSHLVEAGSDRVLIVGISIEDSAGTTTGVTFHG
ncbi:MAG: hypothetical protein O3A00_19340, partial [Planctomycetota bacterium]|nr:hypothetical protein [Planctomycetota bacterium]